MAVLGATLVARARFQEAVTVLRQAEAILQNRVPRTRWYKPFVQSALGAALAGQRDLGAAERLLVSGYEGLRDLPTAPRAHLRTAAERLAAFYAAAGRPQEAAAWHSRLEALRQDPTIDPARMK